MIDGWNAAREEIVVPTPVITEFLYVKPGRLADRNDTKQPYVMAPQFGRTLKSVEL